MCSSIKMSSWSFNVMEQQSLFVRWTELGVIQINHSGHWMPWVILSNCKETSTWWSSFSFNFERQEQHCNQSDRKSNLKCHYDQIFTLDFLGVSQRILWKNENVFYRLPFLHAYFINHCLAVFCKFLGDFWAFWETDIFSQRIG